MANKIKKVSINAIEKAVKENYSPVKTIDWNGLEIVITPTISLKNMLGFVKDVSENCFTEDNGAYLPEVKDFAVKNAVIAYYTNLTLPTNTEKCYDLIYTSGLADIIITHINQKQFNDITNAVNSKIEHLANANIDSVNKQMNNIYAAFENLQTNMEELFSGVDNDDLKGLVSAISNGQFDETKIVEAYLNKKAKTSQETSQEE
jgi:hypothetical protein